MKKYLKRALIEVVEITEDGDYLVQDEGQNNDQYLIKNDVFESTYAEVTYGFGWAIQQLKSGKKVAREGWNGKGMFLYLVKGQEVSYENLRGEAKKVLAKTPANEENTVIINGHIDMRAADCSVVVGWLASQTDMLSDDWVIVE